MTADTALFLDGGGRLDYSMSQSHRRDLLLSRRPQGAARHPAAPSSLELRFRTRSRSGTLLHIQESSNYTTVKVKPGGGGPLVIGRCLHPLCRSIAFPQHSPFAAPRAH